MPERRHRVHFSFWLNGGVWHYGFIGDGVNRIGPVRKTRNPETLRGVAERGQGFPNLEAEQMFNYAIRTGRGGLYLSLSDEQVGALTR